jgi:hypothetical protein
MLKLVAAAAKEQAPDKKPIWLDIGALSWKVLFPSSRESRRRDWLEHRANGRLLPYQGL